MSREIPIPAHIAEAGDAVAGRYGAMAINARVLRAAYDLSIREVAERSGRSREMVRRIERGDPNVRLDAVAAVAAVFGLRVNVMLRPSLPDLTAAPAAQTTEKA